MKIHQDRILFSISLLLLLVGCAGTGDQFAEGLRVMTGKGGTVEKVDTFPDLQRQAAEIARHYPLPRWQQVFQADAADIFELLPGNRLLLGEVQVSSAIAEPEYGDLSLYDTKARKKLWSYKRRDLEWGRYDILVVKSTILLQGVSPTGGYLVALDMKSGRTVWEHDYQATQRLAYDRAKQRIYLFTPDGRESRLQAINAINGKVLWQRQLAGVGANAAVEIISTRDALFILAGGVYRLSPADGGIRWHQAVPAAYDNPQQLRLRLTRHGVLLWDWRRMSLLDTNNGKIRWGPVYPRKPWEKKFLGEMRTFYDGIKNLAVPAEGDAIYFITSIYDNVCKYDLRTGKQQWQYTLPPKSAGNLQSPLALIQGKLYFSTYKNIFVVNAGNGKGQVIKTLPFLESGLVSEIVPDVFISRGDKVFMIREGGAVYAFSGKTDRLLWQQVIDWKYEMFYNTTQINNTLKDTLTQQAYLQKRMTENSIWWRNWTNAVDFQWRDYHYKGSADDPGLSHLGESMVLFQTMVGLSESIERGLKADAMEGLAERLTMELHNANKNHLRSIQQGYFIRPYDSRQGTLVMLVHLDTGKRYDLVYSPVNIGMRYIDMRLPAFIIDPKGRSLYAMEVGPRPEKYTRYVKFKYGMPYPSILQYNLADLKFK